MQMKLKAEDAVVILIEMTAESIATTRLLIDAVCELTYPDDEILQIARKAFYRQKSEEARIAILHKIYEHRGYVDPDDLFENPDEPKKD